MTDPKKIVIKINRPGTYSKVYADDLVPEQITGWNIKRIAVALLIAVLFIILPYYFLDHEDGEKTGEEPVVNNVAEKPDSVKKDSAPITKPEEVASEISIKQEIEDNTQTEIKAAEEMIELEPVVDVDINSSDAPVQTIRHYNVPRGVLAEGLNNNEPYGEIKNAIKAYKTQAGGAFYFTEIKNMKGQLLYHQWLREGQQIYKKAMRVPSNQWQVYTSKLFAHDTQGNWTVRLIDKSGRIYHEIKFKVVGSDELSQ